MQLVGDIGGGRFGPMTQDQAVSWLMDKDTRRTSTALKNRLKTCVGGILGDPGTTDTGGGNKDYAFDGLPVYHESAGVGMNDGMSVFYAKRPGGIAKVCGLGYHTGAQTYRLTWVDKNWRGLAVGGQITFDS